MKQERGFTLIELLIAVTLVAAISAGLLTSMNNGLLTMQKTQQRQLENRTALGIQDLVRRQLGGVMPVRGACGPARDGVDIFRGNPNAMLLVTNESMTEGSRGLPRVALYRVMPNADRTVRLEVLEAPFSGPAGAAFFCGTNPREIGVPGGLVPYVLFDRLAYCRFRYRMINTANLTGREWVDEWVYPRLPHTILIDMQNAPGNSTRMPIAPITIQVHASRTPGESYLDE